MKIAVIGAGAIGALVAGYLAEEGGSDIILIGKEKDVSTINKHELIIEGVRGKKAVPVEVTDRLDKGADLVILTVKTQDIAPTLNNNIEALKDVTVLTVQNGVRAEEILAEFIPREKIMGSVVLFGATYLEPGKVLHNFEGDWLMGRAFAANDEEMESIARALGGVFSVSVTDKIREMKWLKLFLNLNNCLPALTGESMQETFSHLDICQLGIRLLGEALMVVDKAGIELKPSPSFPVEKLRALTSMPLEEAGRIFSQTMTNLSQEPLYGSILQSIQRGRPSEIDYFNGEIVHLGGKIGVPAPLNEKLVGMVHNVESGAGFSRPQDILSEVGR